MKKFAFLVVSLFAAVFSAFSDDIIITTESEKIDAVIETVSETEVHYKKASNPTGPTFIINTSKIASIIYANGEVQAFKKTDIETKTEPEQKTENNIAGLQMYKADNNKYVYNDITMNENEYVSFLQMNCPIAYEQYKLGNRRVNNAKGLLTAGIFADIAGIIMTVLGADFNSKGLIAGGSVSMAVGTIFEIACIPTWIVGGRQRANAIDTFNSTCAGKTQPQAYWSVNASQNGIGLAFHF